MHEIKRGRGRPKKLNTTMPKPRGRPKGAKNKPKYNDDATTASQQNTHNTIHDAHSNDAHEYNIDDASCSNESDQYNRDEGGYRHDELGNSPDIESGNSITNKIISNTSTTTNHIDNEHNNDDLIEPIVYKSTHKNFYKNTTAYSKPTIDISNIEITPELVVAARRELANSSLADYACMIDIPMSPMPDEQDVDAFGVMKLDTLAAHHLLLCNELQEVADKQQHNLMVFMPPGSAKSTYVSTVFPAWYLSKYPRKKIIYGSYSDEPAINRSKLTKQLVNSPSHKALFPSVSINRDSSANDNWSLTNASSFMARGISSDVTSYRSDLNIFDDPIKGKSEVESETIRNKAWNDYIFNFCSRLKPGCCQILVMTRWHDDDIAGRILPEGWNGESGDFTGRDGRLWRVISLPAIADRVDDPLGRNIGEGLWPEWFPMSHWAPFRMNSSVWSSLYQQKPSPDDGIYFLRDSFKRYTTGASYKKQVIHENVTRYIEVTTLPNELRYYGTSDYAVTDDKGDYTVLRIWGVDDSVNPPDIYRVAGWKGKKSSDVWIKEQIKLMKQYKPLKWFGEAGSIQKAIDPTLIAAMREAKVFCNMIWMPSTRATGGKTIRARPAQALVQEGRIHVIDDVEGDAFIDECVKFPAAKHDDDVDNLALIGRAIDQITVKRYKPVVVPVPRTVTPFNRNK